MRKVTPLLLGERDVVAAAPPLAEIISIIEETYRLDALGQVQVPPKFGVHPAQDSSFLHAMPAWVGGTGALGMKWVSYYPANAAHDAPDSTGIIILNDPATGIPVAIMEGMWITFARTAGCAAVAAKYLAGPAPKRLGLVGCGGLGRWSLLMLGAQFPSVEEVFVASKRPETRRAFCDAMAAEGPWKLTPVDDVRAAVEGMDIVVTSLPKTNAFAVKGDWWSEKTLLMPLDIVSGWDDEVFARAGRLVCDGPENLRNMFTRFRPNLDLAAKPPERLQDVVLAGKPGAGAKHCLAVVTGIASTDLTVAWEIYRRAEAMGIGTRFSMT